MQAIYKSLLVKSIRLGWPAGCRHAAERLPAGLATQVAACQLFEDVWPTAFELAEAMDEIRRRDWQALCSRGAHHAVPGLTARIMASVDHSQAGQADLLAAVANAARGGVPIAPRAAKCYLAWLEFGGQAVPHRIPAADPATGIPEAAFDRHVGRWRPDTILTGTTDGHRALATLVQQKGWQHVQGIVLAAQIPDTWSTPSLGL